MRLVEALVPEAHCSAPVLEHGNNHHRNSSSSEINCFSHTKCFFIPLPAHSITHLKQDGAVALSSSSCFLWVFQCKWSQARSQILKIKKNKNYLSIREIKMKTLAWSKVQNQIFCRIEFVSQHQRHARHVIALTRSLLSEAKQQQTTLCLWIENEEGCGTQLRSSATQEFNVPVLITVQAIVATKKKIL